MSDLNLNEVYNFLLEVVPKCGMVVLNAFYKEKDLATKCSFADIVTETDQLVEKTLIEMIKAKYPTHNFIGEESTNAKIVIDDKPVWIIDPIDGTTNFVHKFPYCCISIGFFNKKEPQIAVIYNPATDELFSAIKNQGAYLNGKTIKSSKQKELKLSQIITEFGSGRDEAKLDVVVSNMRNVITNVHSIRCLGSAALNMCYVARGSADAYYEFGIHVWDVAAGMLIAREAGCVVSNPDGTEIDILKRRVLCASSSELAQQLIPLIKTIEFESD